MPIATTAARKRLRFQAALLFGAIAPTLLPASIFSAEPAALKPTPVEPKISAASRDAVDQISTFKKPDNIQCDVFAAEPDVANPVAFTIDNQGRVFVCETFRQGNAVTDNRGHDDEWLHADLASRTVSDRIEYHKRLLGKDAEGFVKQDDRIRMLVDKDQDGKVDESIVIASGFNALEEGTGAGVLVRGNTAYYTCIPNLWKLTDEDGDGVSDHRESLSTGYGVRVAFRGHDMHGLIIGPDGRLYFSIGDRGYHIETPNGTFANPESGAVFRCELDGSNLEVVANGLRNPQELAFDNHGNLFTGDNNSDSGDKARWVYVVPGGDSGWRMVYQYLTDRGPFNREQIWYPYNKDVTPAYTVPPIANFSDGPSGLTFDPGTGMTEEFRNKFLLVDFRGQASNSGIRSISNEADGAFFKIKEDGQPLWTILATDVEFSPDGSLYVADWVNGWNGEGKGRIYRFYNPEYASSEQAAEVRRLLASDFKQMGVDALVDLLSHADRRLRMEAQFELAARYSEKELVTVAADGSKSQFARLHATWGLWQIARREAYPDTIKQALVKLTEDTDHEVAVAALNVLAESNDTSIGPTINAAIGNSSPRVAAAAAMAAGRLGLTDSIDVVSMMLVANADKDPILRHAGIMAFAGQKDLASVVALQNHSSDAVRIAAVVALRKRHDARVLEFLTDASPRVVLEAARAIHDDEMLRRHMPRLAELELQQRSDAPLVRRVLNANYRLGGQAAADRIAAIAAREDLPESARVEAIEMLGKWANPGVTDLVMNRYDPLPERSAEPAMKATEAKFEALVVASPKVSEAVLMVASSFGFKSVEDRFRSILDDNKATTEMRVIALRGLLKSNVSDATALIDKLVATDDPDLRIEAVSQLAASEPARAIGLLEKATQSDVMKERQAAWDTLAKMRNENAKAIILKGLDDYIADKLPREVRLNVINAASRLRDRNVRDRLQKLEDTRYPLKNNDPVAYYADSEIGGDARLGKKVFFEKTQLSCVRCHKINDVGGEVGPNLSKIGKEKDLRYLLEAIVAPNAKIAENFKTIIVQTEEGNIYSGIVRSETDDFLELMDANGMIVKVDQDDIVGQKEGLSSMPADLMKSMSTTELRDLVAFLASLDGNADVSQYAQGHAEK